MGSRAADSWAYGTVLRDNLDNDMVFLISFEMGTPMRAGALVGPPDRRWNLIHLVGGVTGVTVSQQDEEYLLLYFQERMA